jgi:hypothetical protein
LLACADGLEARSRRAALSDGEEKGLARRIQLSLKNVLESEHPRQRAVMPI